MDNRLEPGEGVRGVDAEDEADHTSRLERRLSALEGRPQPPEPISVLSLLNTGELRQALALIERAGVLTSGEVLHPEAFREASPQELEALEHWRQLCGEPLDHLELAEELLDRVGEARGWRSPESFETALLLKRLESPDESPWFVGKMAEAIVALYAEMEEHGLGRGGASMHPHVRGAVRRLESLKEMDRPAPEPPGSAPERKDRTEATGSPEKAGEEQPERAEPRPAIGDAHEGSEGQEQSRPWWRRVFRG